MAREINQPGPQELSPLRVRASHSRTHREMALSNVFLALEWLSCLAHTAHLPCQKN